MISKKMFFVAPVIAFAMSSAHAGSGISYASFNDCVLLRQMNDPVTGLIVKNGWIQMSPSANGKPCPTFNILVKEIEGGRIQNMTISPAPGAMRAYYSPFMDKGHGMDIVIHN
ncbi:hypothetical protein [Burkholderia diffusa]|uniref:hypothetical protein n=1 Tax=Burkholderia diffusa TaxID=488732 RepID=UPI000AB1DFC1|nr:hypothetical protein [Burkholderia diffusa]